MAKDGSTSTEKTPAPAETQKQRWLKYGANVAVVCVVVVALAFLLTWLAQKANRRIDTTAAGLYSLKPQTINIISATTQPIKIISLYSSKATPEEEAAEQEEVSEGQTPEQLRAARAQTVADLLDEYRRKGRNIDVEVIDPANQPSKVDALIREVTEKYGGEVQKYRAVMEQYPPIYEKLSQLAVAEKKNVQSALANVKLAVSFDLYQSLSATFNTIDRLPSYLEQTRSVIDKRLKEKPPAYKRAAETLESDMTEVLEQLTQTIEDFTKAKENKEVPEALRAYMAQSLPRYEEMKELGGELQAKIKNLGELKLDDLKRSLDQRNTILVMGADDVRVISFDRVWELPEDARALTADGKLKRRFAGEQQVTGAIISLSNKIKPKVVFARSGGPPLAEPGIPLFRAPGPLALIAQRLRDYNFEVVEKDLSGQWAMQSQMRGQPAMPEPSDEEIKDAVWVVINRSGGRQGPFGSGPPSIAAKVAEHLKRGKSALILFEPQSENMAEALGEYGITLRPDVVAVHEPVTGAERSADVIEQVQRDPVIFVMRQFGDHPITRPVNSLDGIIIPMTVAQTIPKAGYKTTPLLPVPTALKTWGETNLESIEKRTMAQDKPGDLPPPLWAGAAGQKEDGSGRVVVIGSLQFVFDQLLRFPDPNQTERYVARFPANGELFLNSIYWLAGMESMISISPAAMDVSRIAEMKPGQLSFLRWGVVMVVLPGLVIVSGLITWNKRRD